MSARPAPRIILAHIVVAMCLWSPVSQAAPDSNDFVTKLENQLILPVVAETMGAAFVVVIDGRVVFERTYGIRRGSDHAPVTPQTLFRLASVSKTFASAAGSILVREQPISWDTPVSAEVSGLKFKQPELGKQINLRHLMSQTTGLLPHAYTNLIEDDISYERIINQLDKVDFVCAPGECYAYQNVVFSLIGDVVKAASKMDYSEFVSKKLFSPLGMARASFGMEAFLNDKDHAEPHVWNGRHWVPTRTTANYYKVLPAAGVNASIEDMKYWLLAQLGQKPNVLSSEMLDEMQSGVIRTTRQQAHYRQRGSDLGEVYYGLGWRLFDYGHDRRFVHHGGYVRGMRTEMVFNRELQMGLVFLTNSEPRNVGDLVFDFVRLYQAEREPPSRAGNVGE
jgi:beta-lactamase class C